MRPIVSSIGTITYGCARHLATILGPLVGKSQHHVQNSTAFVKEVQGLILQPDEEIRSYDVTALFTSVPVDKALNIIEQRLKNDTTLTERTSIPPPDIVRLLNICLNCTYFIFQEQYYLQIHGAAMGSPVSPIVCNIYMEEFEKNAIENAQYPPRIWKRYVDDTYTILKKAHADSFTVYLNSLDEHIKWTTEGETQAEKDGISERQIPFLDTLSVVDEEGRINTRVYRKTTHTDQYLNFSSNHPLEHKVSVVRTLMKRAETLVNKDEDKRAEIEHVTSTLNLNGYPNWLLKKSKTSVQRQITNQPINPAPSAPPKFPVVIPYIKKESQNN
jgi:hypothetical protein